MSMKKSVESRIPFSSKSMMFAWMISPLNGRKTMSRNSTLTLTLPVPADCEMRPSLALIRSHRQMQRPMFWMTLCAYFL